MSRIRSATLKEDTARLVAEAEELTRRAQDGMERLRVNLLEVRVREFQRQLILGRLRRATAKHHPTPLVTAPSEPTVVTLPPRKSADDGWPPISPTVH